MMVWHRQFTVWFSNIKKNLLSQSQSLKVIKGHSKLHDEYGICKVSLCRSKYEYLVPPLTPSASISGMTLKCGLGFIQVTENGADR